MKQSVIFCGLGAPLSMDDDLPIFLLSLNYEVKIFDSLSLCIDKSEFELIKKATLIVGISLGAMWATLLAKNFPDAKLVLVAPFSGNINDSPLVNKLFKVVNNIWTIKLLNLLKNINIEVVAWILLKINKIPKNCDQRDRVLYKRQMIKNVEYCRKLSTENALKMVKYVNNYKNKNLISSILNDTLIIAGKYDDFCPLPVVLLLNNNIQNSQYVVTNGGHYNVINRDCFDILNKFINK